MSQPKTDLAAMLEELELYDNPVSEKQRSILGAAERLFSARGFDGTSTASIAKEAGVTERTLFKYFATKRHLLRRILFPLLLRAIAPTQVRSVKKIIDEKASDWSGFFSALAQDRWEMARHLGPRLRVIISELLFDDKLLVTLRNLVHEHVWPELIATTSRLQEEGKLRKDIDPELLVRLQIVITAGFAVARQIVNRRSEFGDDNKIADALADILWNGLKPSASTGGTAPSRTDV